MLDAEKENNHLVFQCYHTIKILHISGEIV